MKITTLLTLGLLSGVSCAQTAPVQPATAPANLATPAVAAAGETKIARDSAVLLSAAQLERLRAGKAELESIIQSGLKNLDYEPHPVAILAPGAHYDKNGVNPNAGGDKALSLDAQAAYRAGFCYLLTKDPKFAASAQRIMDAWSSTLTDVTTRQGKFNMSSNMPFMLIAASWVRGANNWDGAAFDKWIPAVVLPASQSDSKGNHGFWGVLMEASAYAYLGDGAGLDKTRARWNELIRTSVEADGGMPEEYERSATSNWRGGPDKGIKGISYTHYALLPASLSAKIFAEAGQPVWETPEGKSLNSAFARAASWTRDPKTFPFYASNNGKLEGVRNAAYFALLDDYYPNADAQAVLNDGEKVGMNGFFLLEMFGADKEKTAE